MKPSLLLSSTCLFLSLSLAPAKDATIITSPGGKSAATGKTAPPPKPQPQPAPKSAPETKETPPEKGSPPAKEENPPVMFQKIKVRQIKVNVLDENSKPVPNVTVNLYGQERGSHWPQNESPEKAPPDKSKADPWWNFKSDDSGSFMVHFPISGEEMMPTTGTYYLVAELPDGRRAVSSRIFHGMSRDEAAEYESNEWDAEGGGDWIFTHETQEMDLVLTPGHTITGTVVSPDGKPVSGQVIQAIHDLHVDSHTGAGGEVFKVEATSDKDGKFKLEHVYPVACALHTNGAWVRTRVTYKTEDTTSTRWLNQSLDKLPDFGDDETVSLDLVIAPKAPTYHYFGTVTDEGGKPQAGLTVTAGVSKHAMAEDFADSHTFEHATTDAEGKWSLEASAPYVRFFDIKKNQASEDSLGGEGYENDLFDLAAPGEYNLKLRSAKATESATKKKDAEK